MRVSVNFESSVTNDFRLTLVRQTLMLAGLVLLICNVGCVSSGSIQPHQAFRQATTPHQAFFPSQQPTATQQGFGGLFNNATPNNAPSNNYANFSGYSTTPPSFNQGGSGVRSFNGSFGQTSGITPAFGQTSGFTPAFGQNSGFTPAFGQSSGFPPVGGSVGGSNFRPAFNGGFTTGFTSGSC